MASYRSFAYKYILSICGWLFTKFSNAFVFPNPEEPRTINILMDDLEYMVTLHYAVLFSFAQTSKLIIYIYLASELLTFVLCGCCNFLKSLQSSIIITT